jgi:L-lysine 2,3-aminomutase
VSSNERVARLGRVIVEIRHRVIIRVASKLPTEGLPFKMTTYIM